MHCSFVDPWCAGRRLFPFPFSIVCAALVACSSSSEATGRAIDPLSACYEPGIWQETYVKASGADRSCPEIGGKARHEEVTRDGQLDCAEGCDCTASSRSDCDLYLKQVCDLGAGVTIVLEGPLKRVSSTRFDGTVTLSRTNPSLRCEYAFAYVRVGP